MIIYKYLDEKGAELTIEGESVLLSHPSDYNDPFDCIINTDEQENSEAKNLAINYCAFKKIYQKAIVKNDKNISKSDKQSILEEAKLIKETKTYQFQKGLKKHYGKLDIISSCFEKQLEEYFKNMMSNTFDDLRNVTLVSCFSSTFDHPLMWANYADKHAGACLVYEVDDDFIDDVKYQDKPFVFELTRMSEIIFGHDFLGQKVDVTKKEYKFFLTPLFTKSQEWEYENEKRCVFSERFRDSRIHTNSEGKFLLKMPKIKAVYFGCKASDAFVNKIKAIVNNIEMYQMELVPNSYKLIAKKI